MKIATLDDDPTTLHTISALLNRMGYECQTYQMGQEFLDDFQEGQFPDIVLADLYMPPPSGLEVLNEIRKRFKSLPVIIMTSTRDFFSTVNALNSGAYGFLLKPVVFEELKSLLDRVILEQELRKKLSQEHIKLNKAQQKAELGTLAAGIAHEINNPNCAIQGNVEFAQKIWKKLEPDLKEMINGHADKKFDFLLKDFPEILDSIQNGSRRIAQIIKSMSLSAPEPAEPSGHANCRSGIEYAKQAMSGKLREIRLVTEDLVPSMAYIEIDQDLFNQIMVNLFSYAASAIVRTNNTTPWVTVSLSESENGKLKIVVSSQQLHIDRKIMDEMNREATADFQSGRETILNLYITKMLVQRSGGFFSLSETDKGGSSMTLEFPVV